MTEQKGDGWKGSAPDGTHVLDDSYAHDIARQAVMVPDLLFDEAPDLTTDDTPRDPLPRSALERLLDGAPALDILQEVYEAGRLDASRPSGDEALDLAPSSAPDVEPPATVEHAMLASAGWTFKGYDRGLPVYRRDSRS